MWQEYASVVDYENPGDLQLTIAAEHKGREPQVGRSIEEIRLWLYTREFDFFTGTQLPPRIMTSGLCLLCETSST
jgi:hypothetical protein